MGAFSLIVVINLLNRFEMSENEIGNLVRSTLERYPDFPKPGVDFLDIFPLFYDPSILKKITENLTERIKQHAPDATAIVALEARGFLFAPIVAINLGIKFVPIRKKNCREKWRIFPMRWSTAMIRLRFKVVF